MDGVWTSVIQDQEPVEWSQTLQSERFSFKFWLHFMWSLRFLFCKSEKGNDSSSYHVRLLGRLTQCPTQQALMTGGAAVLVTPSSLAVLSW